MHLFSIQSLALTAILVARVAAQTPCDLYYKFDRGTGDVAVNYGTLAVDSKIVTGTTPTNPWVTGKHGGALIGTDNTSIDYAYCETGWKGGLTGDMTISWWMKQRVPPGTLARYAFGGIGSWRCFTGGVAGTGLWMRNWSGTGADIQYPGDIKTPASTAAGVSVALVIDSTNLVAQWYTDGVATGSPITLNSGMSVLAGTSSFNIGRHASNATTFPYDIDEFRMCKRVASPAEIKLWHTDTHAAVGNLGKPCGMTLSTSNGVPKAGNLLFQVDLSGPAAGFRYLIVAGLTPNNGFDMGLAFPALTGCTWYPDFLLQLIASSATGSASFVSPIAPNSTPYSFELQVLGFDGSNNALMSNALSIHVEKQ